MRKYKIYVSIDENEYFWVLIEDGKIINKNPIKEELNGAKAKYYNKTNICHICREENNITDDSILYPGHAQREKDKTGKETEEWVCDHHRKMYYIYGTYEKSEKYYNDGNICEFIEKDGKRCTENLYQAVHPRRFYIDRKPVWFCDRHGKIYYQRYDPNSQNNIIKSLADSRTDNLDPNSSKAEGDRTQRLIRELYSWIDLNKKYDDYTTPIDFIDENGKLHQVQGRRYNSKYRNWSFTHFEREQNKKYEDIICICKSKDGKVIEEIYKFPPNAIKGRESIPIVKNPKDRWGNRIIPWYEDYRVKGEKREEELRRANEINERI